MSKFTILFTVIAFIVGLTLGYIIWPDTPDPNAGLTYGATGLPRNCRAIIKANYDGWLAGTYKGQDAMDSINRNCGEFGISWGIK